MTGVSVGGARVSSVSDRAELGRSARRLVPRSSHANCGPAPGRADPVTLLEGQALTRVPELVPIRYGRMLGSPFAFFRGAALIMAADLAETPTTGLMVQCCGDAHMSNFGVFGSAERRHLFDINDFDETLRGPWEWDLKRLAASLLIAARSNGYAVKQQDRVVLETVLAYRLAMTGFAGMNNLDVWYAAVDAEDTLEMMRPQLNSAVVKRTEKGLSKARSASSVSAFAKLAHVIDGHPRIRSEPPLIVPVDELAEGHERELIIGALNEILSSYASTLGPERRLLFEQFELADFARKVVGVGSVGTRCWIALLTGRDGKDPLFLQIKESEPSVLEGFLGPSGLENHGERVVVGQRLMQASSDIFLGWLRAPVAGEEPQRDFYVRQLKDWKGSVEAEEMVPDGMAAYARLCGWTLARAHARTGDRIAIASYIGRSDALDRAILAFSRDYAEQNQRDYEALAAAARSGRITAQMDL
jgi:uncharacterized protein (DUF2252 family)